MWCRITKHDMSRRTWFCGRGTDDDFYWRAIVKNLMYAAQVDAREKTA
jgi:hypothetical protein